MAYRDYIHCADCDCKLIYDGGDNAREWLEECYGDPSAGTWTAEIVCPDCLKKLRAKLSAAPKVEQEPGGWMIGSRLVLREDFLRQWKGDFVATGRAIPDEWKPVLYLAPPIPQEWRDAVEKAIDALAKWKSASNESEECEFNDMASQVIPMPDFCDADEVTDEAIAALRELVKDK